ncbi:5-formyltetrahydrofolate cyclo-ligase [Lepisosteus oculatus]|uniref:5-formyltetrahydrofolate cyclo-ligase n=1 Tax=Lepisosteus oculatus TaxID=7918 RepID=UPI003714F820
MSALRAAKQALRVDIKKRIATIDDQEKCRQSKIVTQMLIKHPQYQRSQRIAVFLSMHDEVRTEEIIEDIFRKEKVCFIPKYQSKSNHMDMLKLTAAQDIQALPVTSWNIRQPGDNEEREEALATGGLDLILMPGLGFDRSGNRLGRGKGYYDTYLQRCMQYPKGKPYTIGLAFKEQVCTAVPVDENDIRIDEILFEDK